MITKVQVINKSPHIVTSFIVIGAPELYSLTKQSCSYLSIVLLCLLPKVVVRIR